MTNTYLFLKMKMLYIWNGLREPKIHRRIYFFAFFLPKANLCLLFIHLAVMQ